MNNNYFLALWLSIIGTSMIYGMEKSTSLKEIIQQKKPMFTFVESANKVVKNHEVSQDRYFLGTDGTNEVFISSEKKSAQCPEQLRIDLWLKKTQQMELVTFHYLPKVDYPLIEGKTEEYDLIFRIIDNFKKTKFWHELPCSNYIWQTNKSEIIAINKTGMKFIPDSHGLSDYSTNYEGERIGIFINDKACTINARFERERSLWVTNYYQACDYFEDNMYPGSNKNDFEDYDIKIAILTKILQNFLKFCWLK